MSKPITIAIEDLEKDLVSVINGAGLHIAVIKPIVDKIKASVDNEYERTKQKEEEEYARSQEVPVQEVIDNKEVEGVETEIIDVEESL